MNIQHGELAQAKIFITKNLDRIVDWSVGDIRKCCRMNPDGTCESNGALVGSFILWCCAIDFFGGLYTGRATSRETERRFEDFVTKYMTIYDFKKLIDLRWALLHFYTSRHFAFHQSNILTDCERVHLSNSKDGIILDLFCSIRDLETAVNNYRADLEKSDGLQIRLYKYFKKTNPLVPLVIEYDQNPSMKYSGGGGTGARNSGNSAGTTTF
jgi:hypothetical protein